MAEQPELAIVAKLTRRVDGYPQTGRGTIDAIGRGTIEMDPAPQVLVNPDGPEAAAIIKELATKVETAAVIFEEYGRLHRKKGTREGDMKAERNEQYAAEMRAALTRTGAKQ